MNSARTHPLRRQRQRLHRHASDVDGLDDWSGQQAGRSSGTRRQPDTAFISATDLFGATVMRRAANWKTENLKD